MQDRTNTVRCIRLNPFQKSMGKRNSDKSFFPVTMFAEDSLEPSSNLSELLWGTVWESGLIRENKWANVYVSTCQLNASLFSEVTLLKSRKGHSDKIYITVYVTICCIKAKWVSKSLCPICFLTNDCGLLFNSPLVFREALYLLKLTFQYWN